jgi:type VI secretion system protein ImpH
MQRLLDAPQCFHFIQAVRLLESCLLQRGIPRCDVLARHIRFRNSMSLSFPASDIEALVVEGMVPPADGAPLAGEVIGTMRRACLTPAFFSLLGAQGALPLHYTDRIAEQLHDGDGEGKRAFFDCLSHRSVALFYLAWIKGRVEHLADARGGDGYLPLQLALAGRAHRAAAHTAGSEGEGLAATDAGHSAEHGAAQCAALAGEEPGHHEAVAPQFLAHYAALLRGRDMPAPVIAQILSAHFEVPVRVEQFTGTWEWLAPDERFQPGVANRTLGAGIILGRKYPRCDQCADIVIGPLCREDFKRFMPDADRGLALQALLAQFSTGTVRFRVRVILRAQDVRRITLLGANHPDRSRLGWDTFLVGASSPIDREMVYWLGNVESQVSGGQHGK